jgi:hypothetical protein
MRAHIATSRQRVGSRPASRSARPAPGRLSRVTLRRVLVAPAIVALIALAGAWGLASPPHIDGSPAAVGEDVRLHGGILRADRFGDEDVGAMPMPMSGPGMTEHGSAGKEVHVPHGMRRVGIDIVVRAAAGGDGLRLRRSDFELTVGKDRPLEPVGDDMTRGFIPAGASLAGNLAFNVPVDARQLLLRIRGAERPISFSLGAAPPSSHSHH